MQIRFEEIKEEPLVWQRTEEIPGARLDRSEVVSLSPIDWRGRVSYVAPDFHFKAHIEYRQTLRCNRCLKEMTEPVSDELELLIQLHEGMGGQVPAELELSAEDLGLLVVEGGELETEPLLIEQLQLNIPMKPLCRPDCKGLCPQCGQDLNEATCDCRQGESDPRWAALAALRNQLPG